MDLGGRQHAWTPLRFSVPEMMAAAGGGTEPWKSISLVQLFISESNFPHGTRLVFDVGEALAQRMREPTLIGLDAPHHLLLPRRRLSLTFEAAGMMAVSKGSHQHHRCPGEARRGDRCPGPAGPGRSEIGLRSLARTLQPGVYVLRATIHDAQGRQCSQWAQPVILCAGPLYYTARG